jgi:predicted RNase H-like nuclease (RuvC/YqgF family)
MMRDDKRREKAVPIRQSMSNNSLIAGIDLGDSTSLAIILTATGDIADRFCFQMDALLMQQP